MLQLYLKVIMFEDVKRSVVGMGRIEGLVNLTKSGRQERLAELKTEVLTQFKDRCTPNIPHS